MSLNQLLDRSSAQFQAELQLILNAIVEGLCGVDARGNVTFCNDALMKMTGYRAEELIGNNLHAMLHHSRPDGTKYPEEECALRKALDAHQEIHVVGEFLWRKDGTCFPAQFWAHPLGQTWSGTTSVVTIEDISERERAIEALRTSEERFRQISNNIDQAFYLVDVVESRLVYASPAFETITGRSCEEAYQKPSPWRDLAVPEHRERVVADYLRLLAGEETRSEYQIQRSDGSIRWIKDHAKPIWGANGEVSMFAGMAEDITEIHEARDVLRQREEKLSRILASIPDVAWTSDRERRTTYISPKVETVLGYTKQEFCAAGTNLRLGLIHPGDFSRVNQSYQALFEKHSVFDEEYRIRRKDGTWIWIHDRATGIHEENGVPYADGVFSDITARKQAEAELQWKTAFLAAQTNSTMDGMALVDPNGYTVFANQKFIDMFPKTPEIIAERRQHGMLQYALTIARDPEGFRVLADYLNQHPHEIGRNEAELLDGTILDLYSAPVIGDEGKYYGRIWTVRDITERKHDEDTLRQLSTAVEQSPVSVVITDPRGNISYVNRQFTEWSGYSPEEVVGKNPRILKSGRTAPEVYRNLWSTIKQGKEWRGEFCNKKKNGEIYWEAATIRPITDTKGTITHFLAVKEDITERRRAESELRRSEAHLAEAQRVSHVGSWVWSVAQQEIVFWSEEHYRIFGMEPAKGTVPLRQVQERIHPEDLPLFHRLVYESMAQKKDYEADFRIVLSDGSVRNLRSAGHPVVNESGDLVEFVGTCMDVTERKRAEEALTASEKRYRQLFERNLAGVLRTTLDGRILECNPATARIFGYESPEEVLVLPAASLYHKLSDREAFLTKLKSEKTVTNYEMRFRRKDGDSVWVIASLSMVDDDAGSGGIIEGTLVDITERKRAEDEVRESSETVRILLDSIPEAVYGIDLQGRCTFCNPSCLHLLGYGDASELLGKNMHAVIHHTRADGRAYPVEECHIYEAFRRGHGAHIDNEVLWRRDGTSFPGEYWSRPMQRGGKIVGTVVTFVDITERKLTQEALRQSERRYRLLFERNMAGVFRTSLEGRILECNPAAAHLFGCDSPEELLTLPITKFYRTAADRAALLAKLNAEKSVTNHEMKFQRKNGDPAWAMLNLSLVNDDTGGSTIIEGTFVDITERKRAEEELCASRQMLQSILDAIPQRVFWKDRNIIYLGCNRAFATDAGVGTPAAIVGKTDFDLSWSALAELYRADDRLVMEQESPKLNFHEHLSRPDGSVWWIQTNKLPLRDRDGKVTGVIGTYEDITERKQAEKELRLTQFSLERASDAVEWIDSQARIVYVNQAECLALGRSREELLSLSIPDIDPLFPKEIWPTFWEELKTRGSKTFESQHQTKEGRVFPVEVTATYLEFDGQEYCFAFARDVTERRALESQLRHAQKLEGIGQLAAGIAHEINTPTQFVTDNLTFLRDSWKSTHELLEQYRGAIRNAAGSLPAGVTAALEEAERNCDLDFIVAEVPRAIEQGLDGAHRVAKIVRAMKEFSHPDSAEKTAADLNKAIESTITVARNEWKYVAEVSTEFDENLPAVVCHPGDINQVILNLLVNAAHAIKEKVKDGAKGRITVGTRTRGAFAEIWVADTGSGIPEAIRNRVFDPFFTTKEVGKGTGQGLSLAHSVVVKKHGGKIWFETEIGVGTTFLIDLPIKPEDAVKED